MAGIVSLVAKINHFINHQLWRMRLDKVQNKRQSYLLRQLRILTLAIRGFVEDRCMLRSTALTYYTLFSIVPIVAVVFAIAKGFGLKKYLMAQLAETLKDQPEVWSKVYEYADSMLKSTKGGLIAGVGVGLLLWSVIKLLSSIEEAFNDIWDIKKARSWARKITDYLSIMLIAPILVIASLSISVYIKSSVGSVIEGYNFLTPAASIAFKSLSLVISWGLFAFLFVAMPNTKVKFKPAAGAALVTAILFELLQWLYISSQVGVARYNSIYGGFAALPLFLIWVQYSWFIVMFGVQLAFANQNVSHYELENEISTVSIRYRRVISLMIAGLVVRNFREGKRALTAVEIANRLDLPTRLARTIIMEFTETHLFTEVRVGKEGEVAYQPAVSESLMTIRYIIDRLEEKGVNELPISNTEELNTINRLLQDMDDLLKNSSGNMLVKDLVPASDPSASSAPGKPHPQDSSLL